jgi:hypothetical protein
MTETCFVIMPIGDQRGEGYALTAGELRKRYDDVIKEAISTARPALEIFRADDVSAPGPITTDILLRIMQSTFVVADVTYGNPNVFYELGLRHACRTGTILLRDKTGPKLPFDVSHMRCIDYDTSASGLKDLAATLAKTFKWFDENSKKPDNDFLERAELIGFQFPEYGIARKQEVRAQVATVFVKLLTNPKVLAKMGALAPGNPNLQLTPQDLSELLKDDPELARQLVELMLSGANGSSVKIGSSLQTSS